MQDFIALAPLLHNHLINFSAHYRIYYFGKRPDNPNKHFMYFIKDNLITLKKIVSRIETKRKEIGMVEESC